MAKRWFLLPVMALLAGTLCFGQEGTEELIYVGKRLALKVTQENAQVSLDGEAVGQAGRRRKFELSPGLHRLKVSLPRFKSEEFAIYSLSPGEYRNKEVDGQTITPSISWYGDVYTLAVTLQPAGERSLVLYSSHRDGHPLRQRQASVTYLAKGVDHDELFEAALQTLGDVRVKATTVSRKSGRLVGHRLIPFRRLRLEVDLLEQKEEGGWLVSLRLTLPPGSLASSTYLLDRYVHGIRRRLGL